MNSSNVLFLVFVHFSYVFGQLCVLEPLVTIPSVPLCVQNTQCSNANNKTTRNKRSADNGPLPLAKVGSPTFGHFQSLDDDDNDEIHKIDKIVSFRGKSLNIKIPFIEDETIHCDPNSTYRTADGSCNNLKHSNWGKTNTNFLRILYPRYNNNTSGGIPVAVSGNPLPKPRVLSTTLFPDLNRPWVESTLVEMQWGQLIAHDIGMSPSSDLYDVDCCEETKTKNEPNCFVIDIPENDPFFSQFNLTCMNMIRTKHKQKKVNCQMVPYQTNGVTHYIDLSHIYGSTIDTQVSLRQFQKGLLEVHLNTNKKEFPKLSNKPALDCGSIYPNITCFHSGDKRVNQNTQLTCIQTIIIREHNRIANILAELNSNWTDHILFEETRRIVIAEFQHISYDEWMPRILNDDYISKHKLKPLTTGYTDYNNDLNAGTINSFMTAAYRIFHSQIQGNLNMYNETKCPFKNENVNQGRCPFRSINISDYMNRPGIIVEDNNFDSLLLGLTTDPSQDVDRYFTTQMTEMMFHGDYPYGEDLESFDIQRGRDHGIPTYNTFRKLCNLSEAKNFTDLENEISEENIELLASVYESVEDIDCFVGAVLEEWVPNTPIGPTALCIIGEQFVRKKFGDRFWYEAGNQIHSFTEEQLQEIRKSTLSRLLCDNADNITTIQPNSFLSSSVPGNQLVNCTTLPSLNLTKWKVIN